MGTVTRCREGYRDYQREDQQDAHQARVVQSFPSKQSTVEKDWADVVLASPADISAILVG